MELTWPVGLWVVNHLWAKKAGLSVGSLVLFLVVAEVILRVAGIGPLRWGRPRFLEHPDKRFALDAYPDDPRGYFDVDLSDPAVRARWTERGVPGVERAASATPHAVGFEYDDQLCRRHGASTAPREPGVTRIVFIGDSFVEGQGVRGEDTFAARLGRELTGPVEAINCGRRGHDFPMIRTFFERQLAREPDIVVYAMTLNDAEQSESFHARQQYLDDWIMDRRRMYTDDSRRGPNFWEPRLLALTRDRIEGIRVARETRRWYLEMYAEPNRAGWQATQGHIHQMHEAMQARNGELVVALLPLLVDLEGDYPFRELSQTIGDALDVPSFHDTTPAFLGRRTRDLWVHPADHHPNEAAHEIIAAELRPVLQRIIDRRRSGAEPAE